MFLFLKRISSVLASCMFISVSLQAQSITPVREEIVDQEPNALLPGANVVIESDALLGPVTDPGGNHRTGVTPPVGIVSGYTLDEMTRDSALDLNKFTLKVSSSLSHKFNAGHHLQTAYLTSNPPTFQKNLFNRDISLKSAAFRQTLIAPALFMA